MAGPAAGPRRVYPVVFIDALMIKVRAGVVANRKPRSTVLFPYNYT
jgi:hypothetical protein